MTTRPLLLRPFFIIFFSALVILIGQEGRAQIWDGSTSSLWTEGTNWVGDAAPTGSTVATFDGTGAATTTIDLGGTVQSGGIVFNGAGAPSYTIGDGGDTIELSVTYDSVDDDLDADIEIFANVITDQTIAADILLGGGNTAGSTDFRDENRLANFSPNASLNISGDIAAAPGIAAGDTSRLFLTGLGTINLSGNFEETPSATSASEMDVFVRGNGLRTFTGTNNTSGNYLTWIISDGATFTVTGAVDNSLGTGLFDVRNGTVNLNSNQTFESGINIGNNTQGDGDVVVNIGSSNTVALASNITYVVDNDNAFSGTITGGDILISAADFGSRTITVNDNTSISGPELTIGSNILGSSLGGGTGNQNLQKGGAGTLLLSGTASTYNVLFINSGTVQITNDGALGDNDFQLGSGANDARFEYVGTGESIDNQVRLGNNSANNATVTGAGTIANTGSGTVTFTASSFNDGPRNAAVTAARTVTFEGTSDIIVSGTIVDHNTAGGGTISLVKAGTNTLTLNGANTYTGATSVNAGTLVINGTNASDFTVASGANLDGSGTTSGSITFQGTSHTINRDLSSTALGITGTGTLDISALPDTGGFVVNLTGGSASGTIDVLTYGTGGGSLGNDGDAINDIFSAGTGFGTRGATFSDSGTAIQVTTGREDITWVGGVDGNWDINSTQNWSSTGNVFFDGDNVTFDETATTTGTITLQSDVRVGDLIFEFNDEAGETSYVINGASQTITLDGTLTFDGSNAATGSGNDVTINSVIAGDGSIFVGDLGGSDNVEDPSANSLVLTAANTFTGGVTVVEHRLGVQNANALGTGTVTLIDDNGSGSNRTPVVSIEGNFTIANNFVIDATGTEKTIRSDDFNATNSRDVILTGTITNNETGAAAFNLQAGDNDTITVTGLMSGSGGLEKVGNGIVTLTNDANSFVRQITVSAGTLQVTSIGDDGEASAAGANSNGAVGFTLGNNDTAGTLEYTGAGAEETDRQFFIGDNNVNTERLGGGTVRNSSSGGGTLTFDNAVFNQQRTAIATDSDRSLTFDANLGDIVVTGVIQNNTADATIALVKEGAGTLTLSGDSTYTGTTTVSAGTLIVDGNNASATGDVTVASGATLGGIGTVGGLTSTTSISSGATLTGATAGTTGTLTFGNDLTLTSGSNWLLDLVQDVNGDSDRVNVTGSLTLADATLLDTNFTGDFTRGNVYTIAQYGTLSGTFSHGPSSEIWLDGTDRAFGGGTFRINYMDASNTITLTAVPEPRTVILLGVALVAAGFLRWRRRRAVS